MTTRFTVRTPVDFIALAPVVLGFQPTQSLVMMTINSFHARIDIPTESDIEECINALLDPAVRHNVGRVAFVLFDDGDHDALTTALMEAFASAGIEILAAIQAGEGRYRPFDGDWRELDIASHPMVLEAQYLDLAPKHASRAELAAHVQPCGETWTPEVQAAVESLRENGIENTLRTLRRETAKEQVALWIKAMRGCEAGSDTASQVAIVLAFSGWLAGDGALAWVALDLADSSSNWHLLLSTALEQAVNPERWSEIVV